MDHTKYWRYSDTTPLMSDIALRLTDSLHLGQGNLAELELTPPGWLRFYDCIRSDSHSQWDTRRETVPG